MSNSDLPASGSRKRYQRLGFSTQSNGTAGPDGAKVDFSAIWTTVRRSKWIILLTCLLVTGAVTVYTFTLPKVYESSAIVSVGASPGVQSANVWPAGEGIELSKEIGLLENSGELNRRVVERLASIADTARANPFTIFDPIEGRSPTTLDVVTRLRERTKFQGRKEQAMIQVEATSGNSEEATYIVDAFAEEYRQFSREMARSGVTAAREFLEAQVEKRRQEVQNIENEWESFALANDIAADGAEGQRVVREYVQLEGRRNTLQFELEQQQRLKATLERQLEEMRPSLRMSVVAEQRVQSLRRQIDALQGELAQLRMRAGEYYANNPSLEGDEARVPELAELKRRIDRHEERKSALTAELVSLVGKNTLGAGETGAIGQMETLRTRIGERELEITQLREQIRGLDREIALFQNRISSIPRQTIQREQIQRQRAQAEEFYQEIAGELRQTLITEESELGYVNVVRAGVVPRLPVSPDIPRNILLGVLLGLGFGVGLAFILQSVNSRFYEPEDVQSQGFNLLGVVPEMDDEIREEFNGEKTVDVVGRTLSTTLLPLLNPWSTTTENYRLMRTNLQYPISDDETQKSPQVLLVTSPEPGDGKTTTAVNLALTFALSGREVLLIDGDLRRPSAHELLGLDLGPGLADVLTGEMSLRDATQIFVEDLSVVPAGETKVAPSEMLDSRRMRSVFAEARARADVVIIDTPPVLAASDALILAVNCDATLVVANAGTTDRQALDQVEKVFGAVGVPVSAVIFNRFDTGAGYYEYGYGDGYHRKHPELNA
jgi:capsular exopolysaccharide synthesis family protein